MDFRAFYCAGKTLASGMDPYRVEPITGCQAAFLAASRLNFNPQHALFAPLPPYAIAPFAILSAMPSRVATALWLTISIVAIVFSVQLLVRLTALPAWACTASLLVSDGWASLVNGQLVPVVLAAILYTALAVREDAKTRVLLGLAIASLEPHLAAPLWIGIFLFRPNLRVRLGLLAALIIAVSLAFGFGLNIEYFTMLLPSHARSELYNYGAQYSLSALLAAYGTPAVLALRLGSISYAFELVLGLGLGFTLAKRLGDRSFLVTAPVATVVFAGPFIHIHQMVAAIPLALSLFSLTVRGSIRSMALATVILLLAIPWQTIVESPLVADHRHYAQTATIAAPHLAPTVPSEFIVIPYTAYVDAYANRADRRSRLEKTLWKLPTWLALGALICLGFGTMATERSRNEQTRTGRLLDQPRFRLRSAIRR
jgi:hypothetical protein